MRYIQLTIVMVILGLMAGGVSGKPLPGKETKEDKFIARNGAKSGSTVEEKEQHLVQSAKMEKATRMPVYKPPKRGAPGGRVGGGTRGDAGIHLMTHVLAPGQVRGLTSQDQPDLYWYVSKSTNVPIEFTLIDEDGIEPLVETRLPSPVEAGIQRIRLSDFGVRLSPEKMYRWSVALILDPEHRSKDLVASARIQRALPSEVPKNVSEHSDAVEATFIHAEAGLWYDAIAAISRAIKESPEETRLQQIRNALLDQVNLEEVARFDRIAKKKF
ncbi:DUF928 domain-containing protein [Candidatus Nitronereus thalassa]|uniref:DUF928 domain-containing protein n=1 Tax=Candidatus Nitronereus thalassa TaxID=3020898 RepID=A0ABU3K9D5_9BACT|nr:DUF928 domain-containing protein [Candidatus Nitronereus thalassa]MDT7043025.1 DUF928 domain-containing protein [Candidatus Nitronereus thalassa]